VAGAAHLLDVNAGAHFEFAPALAIGVGDDVFPFLLRAPVDHAAGGKIWPLDKVHQVLDGDAVQLAPVVERIDQRVAHLAQVVGRDGSGHAHGDAGSAVDQQVGDGGGEDGGFLERVVKVGYEIHRVLVQVGQDLGGDGSQAGLCVTHRCRSIAIDRAKVTLTIHQRGAQGKVLRHACHRFVHGCVSVGMVLAQHLADDAGRFLVRRVGPQAQVVHGVEDAALDRLESVAGIGQRARDDDAHCIVQICHLHFGVNIYLTDGSNFHSRTPVK
jgi:hypothetical protein